MLGSIFVAVVATETAKVIATNIVIDVNAQEWAMILMNF